jgi:hypothetical protein
VGDGSMPGANLPGMGGIYNSRNLQTYHYAGNNPIVYSDPTGEYTAGTARYIIKGKQIVQTILKIASGPAGMASAVLEYSIDEILSALHAMDQDTELRALTGEAKAQVKKALENRLKTVTNSLRTAANHLWEGARDNYNLAQDHYREADALDEKAKSMDPNDPNRASIVAQAQRERDMGNRNMEISENLLRQGHEANGDADQAAMQR